MPQSMQMPKDSAFFLDNAKEVLTNRGGNYGTPEDNFGRIRSHWVSFIKNRFGVDLPLTAADTAVMMILLKTARLENQPGHEDSWQDIIGYAAAGAPLAVKPEAAIKEEPKVKVSAVAGPGNDETCFFWLGKYAGCSNPSGCKC